MPLLWDLFSLFPAHAGVIPNPADECDNAFTFPRPRGGDPSARNWNNNNATLFPAHAGVIP